MRRRARIDIRTESLLSFGGAGRHLAAIRGGRPPRPSTFYRWATRGLRGHRLEVIRCGGRVATSVEALQRFFNALTGEAGTAPIPSAEVTSRATASELDRRGI